MAERTSASSLTISTLVYSLFGMFFAFVSTLLSFGLVRLLFVSDLTRWWQRVFAEPAYAVGLWLLEVTDGRSEAALFGFAVIAYLFARASLVIPMLTVRYSARNFAEGGERIFDDARAKLRTLFSDDTEKIALYEAHFGKANEERGSKGTPVRGCTGCLISAIWGVIAAPIVTFFWLAILNAVERLFVQPPASMSTRLRPVSIWNIDLSSRSWVLILLLAVVLWLAWLLENISISGWTWPSGSGCLPWVVFAVGLLISWTLLRAALVLFILFVSLLLVLDRAAIRLILSPMLLSVRGWWYRRKQAGIY